jgi:hypothetical protein
VTFTHPCPAVSTFVLPCSLQRSSTFDSPPALAVVAEVGVAVVVVGTGVVELVAEVIVVATAAVVGVALVAPVAAAAPVAPPHRLLARARTAPPGRPSTTPGLSPSTCGQAHPSHRSRPNRRTPSSLHRRWGHHSHLL